MISDIHEAALELGGQILAAPSTAARAALTAAAVVQQLPGCACVLYRFTPDDNGGEWSALGIAGDAALEQESFPAAGHLISELLSEEPGTLLYRGQALRREDYAHLHIAHSLESLAYVPLLHQDRILGAIEIVSFSAALEPGELEELAPIVQLASPAIVAGDNIERQRQDLLDALHRMSQLYDLESR